MLLRVFVLCFLVMDCFAQLKTWQDITVADGLSHGSVSSIMQTRDGYIWMATPEGLNRYDGYNIKIYQSNASNPYTLRQNHLSDFFEDAQSRIWISTKNEGVSIFDRKSEQFFHCRVTGGKEEVDKIYTTFKISEDSRNDIWVSASHSKLFRLTLPKSWKNGLPNQANFTNEVALKAYQIASEAHDFKQMLLSKSNKIWLGGIKGHLFEMDITSEKIKEWILPTPNGKMEEITGFYEDGTGAVWISQAYNGLSVIKQGVATNYSYKLTDNKFPKVWIDKTGYCWIKEAETNRVWRVSLEDYLQKKHFIASPIIYSFSKSYQGFLTTKEGTIFACDSRGVKKIDAQQKIFRHYMPEVNIHLVFQDRLGRIFYGSSGYTRIFDELNPYTAQQAFKEAERVSILHKSNGEIWATGYAKDSWLLTLFRYNQQLQLLDTYKLQAVGDGMTPPPPIIEDRSGNIWIGGHHGQLIQFDNKQQKINTFTYKNVGLPVNRKTPLNTCWSIYEDPFGDLWVGTESGLWQAKKKEGGIAFQKSTIQLDPKTTVDNVLSITSDPTSPRKYLWLCTKNYGLIRLNKEDGSSRCFDKKDGLPSNSLLHIVSDSSKNFWISSINGIFSFNTITFKCKNYNRADGLQGETFNPFAVHQASNGEILFGGLNGFNVFRPSHIKEKEDKPQVRITGIETNGQLVEVNDPSEILQQSIDFQPSLLLSHLQNTIKLNFAVLNFNNPTRNRFRYQLEGYDRIVMEAGNDHTVIYSQLPAGNYVFKLWGSTGREDWNDMPVTLNIKVKAPWFWDWWSITLYMLLVVYIGYRFYQNQINRIKLSQQLSFEQKAAERLAALDTLKTRFFTNISHEFRTPLTLLVSPLIDLHKKYPAESIIPAMQRNVTRLQTLINQLLDLSKLEANQLKVELIEGDLAVFLRQLFASFESLAQNRQIIFGYSQSHQSYPTFYDGDKIEKIVTNLLSNAFKFTPENGRVNVRVEYNPTPTLPSREGITATAWAAVTVQDFGIGIEPERLPRIFDRFYQAQIDNQRNYEGTGIGLALVKELVEVLNGQIAVTSNVGKGTTFTVKLPLENQPQSAETGGIAPKNQEPIITPDWVIAEPLTTHHPSLDINSPMLLIVEDNPDLRAYICSIFEQNYQIIEANDGEDGLQKAFDHVPDLVISDLMMPRLDGLGFCQQLKTDIRTNHIPVVMLTAKAALDDRLEGLKLGADDYLSKPFNRDELEIRVANLLQQRQTLRQKYAQQIIEVKAEPAQEQAVSLDELFLEKAQQIVHIHLSESSFEVDQFCKEMGMSRTNLHRKLKALTDTSTTEFTRKIRLQRAAQLLQQASSTVSEVAYQVGFESLPYFSKSFQEQFGISPSEYARKK